jgi:hypothetical protein
VVDITVATRMVLDSQWDRTQWPARYLGFEGLFGALGARAMTMALTAGFLRI